MIRGFYRMTFTGINGSGFGILAFKDSIVAGADVAGTIFDGTFIDLTPPDKIEFKVIMRAPAGVAPVQTGVVLAAPIEIEITGTLSEAEIESGAPTRLETALGPVNVLFQKIRDF
jgi:hypothetical protein